MVICRAMIAIVESTEAEVAPGIHDPFDESTASTVVSVINRSDDGDPHASIASLAMDQTSTYSTASQPPSPPNLSMPQTAQQSDSFLGSESGTGDKLNNFFFFSIFFFFAIFFLSISKNKIKAKLQQQHLQNTLLLVHCFDSTKQYKFDKQNSFHKQFQINQFLQRLF